MNYWKTLFNPYQWGFEGQKLAIGLPKYAKIVSFFIKGGTKYDQRLKGSILPTIVKFFGHYLKKGDRGLLPIYGELFI